MNEKIETLAQRERDSNEKINKIWRIMEKRRGERMQAARARKAGAGRGNINKISRAPNNSEADLKDNTKKEQTSRRKKEDQDKFGFEMNEGQKDSHSQHDGEDVGSNNLKEIELDEKDEE